MATHSGATAVTAAVTGTATVDTYELTRTFAKVELIHHGDVDEAVYYRTDGVAPVAGADDNKVLLPTERLTIPTNGAGVTSIDTVAATGIPTLTLEGVA